MPFTKFKSPTKCSTGAHEWVVTSWKMTERRRDAVELSCRFCLTSIDTNEKIVQQKLMNDAMTPEPKDS